MHLDTIHLEVTYNAPAERVWQALTDPEQIRKWCFDVPAFSTEEGSEFEFRKSVHQNMFLHRCKILDAKDEKRLQYTWTYPDLGIGESVVTWELIPRGSVTSVRLIHEHLLNHKDGGDSFSINSFDAGWSNLLRRSLADFLEK